MKENTHDYQGI